MELGSSCLALTGVGRSPRKESQTRGAFCPKAWLCKRWGKGQEFVELVLSLEPPLPAGVRMGERVADFGLESLEMRIAAQHAVLFDKQIPWVPASKAVNLQASQTPFCLECGHELVPHPPTGLPNARLCLSPNPCFPRSAKAHCLARPTLLGCLIFWDFCLFVLTFPFFFGWWSSQLPGPSPKHYIQALDVAWAKS